MPRQRRVAVLHVQLVNMRHEQVVRLLLDQVEIMPWAIDGRMTEGRIRAFHPFRIDFVGQHDSKAERAEEMRVQADTAG